MSWLDSRISGWKVRVLALFVWMEDLSSNPSLSLDQTMRVREECVGIAAFSTSKALEVLAKSDQALGGDSLAEKRVAMTFEVMLETIFGEGQDVFRITRGAAPFKFKEKA